MVKGKNVIKLPGSPFSPWCPFVCRARGCHTTPADLVNCWFSSVWLRNKIVLNSCACAHSKRWDSYPPCLWSITQHRQYLLEGVLRCWLSLWGEGCQLHTAAEGVKPTQEPLRATLWDHLGGTCPQQWTTGFQVPILLLVLMGTG